MLRLYTPKNLDISGLLEKTDKLKKRKKYIQRYKYVVSLIIYNQLNQTNTGKKNPYVNICQSIIRDIIGRSLCVEIFNDLKEWQVIVCDGKAKPNSKCSGYKLGKSYISQLIKEDIISDMKLWDNILRHNQSKIEQCIKNQTHLQQLYNYLKRVEIDYVGAKNQIDQTYPENSKQFNSRLLAIGKIHEGDLFFTRDQHGKRLHTNISSFPKDLRRFLKVKSYSSGKYHKLVEIDIKNSQPLFLLVFLIKYHHHQIPAAELRSYKEIVECGFYEYFMDKLAISSREQVKEEVFSKLLYNDTNTHKLTGYEILLKSEFPSIFKVLMSLKKRDYTLVSHRMQEVESRFIIDTIAKEYTIHHPNGFLVTIHDSVILPEEHSPHFASLMRNKLKKLYGIEMKLHTNPLF